MNIWNVAKGIFALYFIVGWVSLAFVSTIFVALIPIIPFIGALVDVVIAPIWFALGIIALPISVAVSLKLLSWIDAGANELGIKLKARSQFVKARNKLTKNLPRWAGEVVNFVT